MICGLYVDDIMIIGNKYYVLDEIEMVQKSYSIRVNNSVFEYIGCQILPSNNKSILYQSKLIDKIVKEFEDSLNLVRNSKLPMSPHTHIRNIVEEDEKLFELNIHITNKEY